MRINPFKQKPRVDKPNRNAFDLSHAVNFTAQFGKLYPILCQEVVPGDSFNIRANMGLRLMPLAFPVQSRMRADIHYFYVRNRNLWKDWTDFIGATKDNLTPPFIQRTTSEDAKNIFGTGTLGDFFGIPTTVASSQQTNYISIMDSALPTIPAPNYQYSMPPVNVGNDIRGWRKSSAYPTITLANTIVSLPSFIGNPITGTGTPATVFQSFASRVISQPVQATSQLELLNSSGNPLPSRIYLFEATSSTSSIVEDINEFEAGTMLGAYSTILGGFTLNGANYRSSQFQNITLKQVFYQQQTIKLHEYINKVINQGKKVIMLFEVTIGDLTTLNPRTDKYNPVFTGVKITNITNPYIQDMLSSHLNPYIGTNPEIRINALPFRAYESIYNSFYRNQQNDPFKIGNVVEYNKFITTNEGGADTTPYILQNRNWEDDFLTTCVPSPQQGIAPLVGARQSENTYNLHTSINGTPTDIQIKGGDSGELTAINTYTEGTPESVLTALNQAIEFGISINDFRNVNSLQRWLEKNMRRGFRYKDQILSHFGVEVRFDELDMPEFLGGLSQDIQVNSVTQTVDTPENPLGSYAGQGFAFGGSKHDVNHYFDEHGYIIGILSIVPIPSYSQLLPKHLIKANHLDYYTPEFGHIGMQPVLLKEVAPNEAKFSGTPLDKVFGYQRPFYDYLAAVDRVHGQMRTSMRDFLVNRYFEGAPELGSQFLRIDSEEINDIFTVTDDSNDKIIGQVYFDITAKRPISRFAEPRID